MTTPVKYGMIPEGIDDQRAWLIDRGYLPILQRTKIPAYSGVYVIYSQYEDRWLYVGQSSRIRTRVYCGEHHYPRSKALGHQPILYVKHLDAPDYLYEEALLTGLLMPVWNFGQCEDADAKVAYEKWKKWKRASDRKAELEAHKHTADHNEFKTNESRKRLAEVLAHLSHENYESSNKLYKEVVNLGRRIHGVSIGGGTFSKYKDMWWHLLSDEAKLLAKIKPDVA